MVNYGGFWRRFSAAMIDGIILMLVILPIGFIPVGDKFTYFALHILETALGLACTVYFHGKFGQTPGKMVCGLVLKTVSLEPINFRHAILRSSVEIGFYLIGLVGAAITVSRVDLGILQAAHAGFANVILQRQSLDEFSAMAKQFEGLDPTRAYLVVAMNVWVWSEFITLLFNKKKRALHDFIAGTVVILKPKS